eukprot:4261786-Alexandrium_andersonii.AAC.1
MALCKDDSMFAATPLGSLATVAIGLGDPAPWPCRRSEAWGPKGSPYTVEFRNKICVLLAPAPGAS